jgi:Ca2+-binding EF-hand superfamily protein
MASQLISSLGGSNGSVSLSDIEKKLGLSGGSSSSTNASEISSLTSALKQLDTNGDGTLSQGELSSALQAAGPPPPPPPMDASSSSSGSGSGSTDLAAISNQMAGDLINSLGGSNGEISSSHWQTALSGDTSSSSTATSSDTSSTSNTSSAASKLFSSLDTNGDGTLSSSELATALQSFLSVQSSGQDASSLVSNTSATSLIA